MGPSQPRVPRDRVVTTGQVVGSCLFRVLMGSSGEGALPGYLGSSAGRRDSLGAAGACASEDLERLGLTCCQPWASHFTSVGISITYALFHYESHT